MRQGTNHTEETRTKISQAKTGVTFTEEHSLAISTALKGRKKSAAHRKAISEGIRAAHARRLANVVTATATTTETVA